MNRQLSNLIVLFVSYLIVWAIAKYSEKITDPVGNGRFAIDFIHYALLGYFSSKYWLLIIAVGMLYDIYQLVQHGIVDFLKRGMVQVASIKFIGLVSGVVLNKFYPMRINLLSYIEKL